MNVATMRRVDAWLGLPACALLTAARKLADALPLPRRPRTQRVLFLKLAEQGSTVLAQPALLAAVERVGRENVHFAAFEENRAILDAMDVLPRENVIAIRTGSLPRTLLGVLGALRRMRRLRFDAVIDLEFFARSTAILAYLSGAARRVGLHAFAGEGPWRGDLFTHRLPYNPHLHTAQLFRLELDALALEPERFPTLDLAALELDELPLRPLQASEEAKAALRARLCRLLGLAELPPLVLLNANCSDLLPLRRWEDERYLELARRLLEREPQLWIGFTGAPSEAAAVEALVRRVGRSRCVSLAGRTSMAELLVLYELAEVLVTNDSGPAHFASLSSIDVVTLFGPETPALFRGLSPRTHVLWARTPCSPCVSAYNNRVSHCADNVCMQRIALEEVLATVERCLAERRLRGELGPRRNVPAREPGAPLPAHAPAGLPAPASGAPAIGAPVAALASERAGD